MMQIVFLGNSLTRGRYGGNFVQRVAELMPEHDIVNAGMSGGTVINLLARLDRVLNPQPDAVFLMVGGNDAISFSQPDVRGYYRQTGGGPDGVVSPELFAEKYRELLTRVQSRGIRLWIGLPPAEYSPAVVDAFQQYNHLARAAAESLDIPVLDLMAHFAVEDVPERPPIDEDFIALIAKREDRGWTNYDITRRNGGFTFTFDGLHLMPRTAEQVGELIAAFLRKYIG